MKRTSQSLLLAAIAVLLVASGCSDKKKMQTLEASYAALQTRHEQLVEESNTRDEFIQEYGETVTEVYDNLERIRKREGFLSRISSDVEAQDKRPMREKITANLESIDKYIKSSKEKVAALRRRIKENDDKNGSLYSMVDNLNQTIAEREAHIMELKNDIENLNIKFTEVEWQLQEKTNLVVEQSRQLNAVYYIIASEKDLKEKGIIEEKGGLLGIRKTKRLASGFNSDDFMTADMVELNSLLIETPVKKLKIISPHNPNSFHLVKQTDKSTLLEIIDPLEFWKIRYLVIISDS